MKTDFLNNCFPALEPQLLADIKAYSSIRKYTANEAIVKQGQYIKTLPIVISGSVKVISHEEEVSFLLYYIQSGESCIYSFAHAFDERASDFSAVAETDSTLLLLPIDKVRTWIKKYPGFSQIVISDYKKHYQDLLQTTRQVICNNLDERLIKYLKTKSELTNSNLLSLSHQEIADDFGTSREVISRVMKKLGTQNKIEQVGRKIKVL